VAGPAGNADLRRSIIRRDGRLIVSRDSLQTAIRNGATLDRMDFRSGDELVVGEQVRRDWMTYLQVLGAVSGALFLILQLRNL
jgi:hypothetical protein